MLRGISISSTCFTCSGTVLIRRTTDAPLATLKSACRLRLAFEWLPFRFPFSLAWLTSCPDRCPLFFLFQVVVTRGGMRRSASPRDAPHRIRSFLPLRLGFSSTWPTATRGDAGPTSSTNLRIDSPPSRSAFQTVPGHPEADEAGCCVGIAGLGETGVDGQFQLRRGGRSPVQPCTPSPANVRTHSPPSRSTHQSIPGH